MKLVRLTTQNVSIYIGYEILFKTRGKHIVRTIIDSTDTSIKIDHPDLHNHIEILKRKVFVLIE